MSKKGVGQKYEYELSNRLGQGAFAEVYKGRNKITNETVAIKVIKRSLLARYGDEMLVQIHKEVSVLQQLVIAMLQRPCPFINKIYECLETSNNIYIVLEFCNQGTLLDKLKKSKKLPEEETQLIFYQLVNALDFLAENGIAHRDIKPENIFIKDGVYKLGDFGFAGQKQLYQTHLGTYPYMAPEFFKNDKYDGNQVDIWALGLLIHETLFGEIYFIGNSQYEVSQKILNKQYTLGTQHQCSKEVRDLLPRMIEKEKSKRITARQILQQPLMLKLQNNPRILEIMENEKKFLETFIKIDPKIQMEESLKQQQDEEEKQKREEQERQRLLKEQLERQEKERREKIQREMNKAKDVINEMRNGIMIMVKLCEFLQQEFSEVCRYDIFYLLKQTFKYLHNLKEKMDSAHIFTQEDHCLFKDVDEDVWNYFYQQKDVINLINDIEFDRTVIRKSYIDQMNFINNYTQTRYPEYMGDLNTIVDLDIKNGVNDQLYTNQLCSTMAFFSGELKKPLPLEIQAKIKKAIVWLSIVVSPNEMVQGKKINIAKFIQQVDNGAWEGLKECFY